MNGNPADPVLNSDQVLRIANRHATSSEVTGVEESGGEARAYYIDSDKVMKVQRPHRVRERTSQEREVLFLDELSSFPEVTVPQVFGYGREGDSIEYTVMSRMPGQALGLVNPTGEKRSQALSDLGRMLYYLHHLPDQEKLTGSGLFPVDRGEQDLVIRIIEPLNQFADTIAQEGQEWTPALSPHEIVARASARMSYSEKKALHSNPALSHTLVDPHTHALTGLIDLGDAYISHPSNDLRRCLSPQDRQDIFSGYNALKKADDAFMSVWIVNQLLSDFICIAHSNEFRADAVDEVAQIARDYL